MSERVLGVGAVSLLPSSDAGQRLGQAEVEDLHQALGRHHDVLGLQVPVDEAPRVRRRKALGDLRADVQRLAQGQRPVGEQLAEALALDQLHRDVADRAVEPTS